MKRSVVRGQLPVVKNRSARFVVYYDLENAHQRIFSLQLTTDHGQLTTFLLPFYF
jgi:hypothetical protein